MKNKMIYIFIAFLFIFFLSSCNKTVTITLCPMNGEESEKITIKANQEISNLKSFSNPGYSFGGWYYDMGLKNKVEFPLTVNKSITLYGGWYENLNFEFDEVNKQYIVSSVKYSDKVIEIPSIYKFYPVTKIGPSAFFSNEIVEKVIIPDTITEIGESAFAYCENLKSINIPDTVTKIGNKAFNNCTNLVFNNINGLKYIDNWLIDATTAIMRNDELLDSTIGICPYAFYQNQNLDKVIIPSKVKAIFEGTFEESSIKELVIGDQLESIDIYAFKNTINLESVDVSVNNNYFSSSNGVLYNKEQTKLILYPSSKENTEYSILPTTIIIGKRSCMNNPYLKHLTFSNKIEVIEEYAFYNCSNLESVNFNDQLKVISQNAFRLCGSLTDIIIPSSVEKIETNAFAFCNNVVRMELPLTINDNTITISYLFGEDLKSLKSIEQLTILGTSTLRNNVLKGLVNLKKLTLDGAITNIESSSFIDCSNITSLSISDNTHYKIDNNILYTIDGKKLIWCMPYNENEIINILPTTLVIYANAFKDVTKVREIVLNKELKEIQTNAFNSLLELKKLVIDENVDITEQDICINTPGVTIYVISKSKGENWCEGWNTFNYPVVWGALFPKIIVDQYERHINIEETTTFSFDVMDAPENYEVIITYDNDGVGLISDNTVIGVKDGIIIISFEVKGYPDSRCCLYIYVGNI
ncbi:MAG: leucine-rich repeat protein [Bacilli bacterium]